MKNISLVLLSMVLLVSCQDTLNTSLPEYSLDLSYQIGDVENYVSVRLDPVGNIPLAEISATHNGSELMRFIDGYEHYLYNRFYIEKDSNRIVVTVDSDSIQIPYSANNLIPAELDSTHIDTVITGRGFFITGQPYSLQWSSSADPDYYMISLTRSEYVEGFLVETDTSFVTTTTRAEISAKFALPTINLSINSCWGPLPHENEYDETDIIPLNIRACAIYRTRLEGLQSCDTPFAYPCY